MAVRISKALRFANPFRRFLRRAIAWPSFAVRWVFDRETIMHHAQIFGRKVPVPASRPLRIGLGTSFIVLGILGFLPVLGFWMVPVGLTVLAVDIPVAQAGPPPPRCRCHAARQGLEETRRD